MNRLRDSFAQRVPWPTTNSDARPSRIARVAALALAIILAGCSRAPVVTVVNQSGVTLSNVVVSGSGFVHGVGDIAAGGERAFTVHPSGDSGLHIAFDAAGRHVDVGEQGYMERGGGYRLRATIGTNLSVSVSSAPR